VDDAFADSQPADDPSYTYWLNRDEIDVMAGRCLTELKLSDRPITLLTRAVEHYDPAHEREMALYLSWLAEAHIHAENIEEAAATATRALQAASGVSSTRSTERIQLIRHLLAPYQGNQAVDQFEQAALTLLPHPR